MNNTEKKGSVLLKIALFILFFMALVFLQYISPALAGDAVLTWNPNAETDLAGYKVYSGTAPGAYGQPVDVGNVTTYTVTGLGSGTYYFAVSAYDTSGNESGYSLEVSKEIIVTDTTPPVISSIAAIGITTTGATISWTTDEASTSQVEYGVTTAYGPPTAFNPAMVTAHTATLSGLSPSTVYHYRVRSMDGAGNEALSGDNVFTTASPTTTTTTTTPLPTTTTGVPLSTSTTITVSTTTLVSTTTTTTLPPPVSDTTPPADVQNFTASPGNGLVTLRWTNPSDFDFIGVRIRYRTDHYPNGLDDGTLLGDFTGPAGGQMSFVHAGLQNGLTYYYAASSYDGSGNFQATAHAAATPSVIVSDLNSTISGGCGMVGPMGGNPPGPGQAADLMLVALMIAFTLLRNSARRAAWRTAVPVHCLTRRLGRAILNNLPPSCSFGEFNMGTFPLSRIAPAVLILTLSLSACGIGDISSDASQGSGTDIAELIWGPPTSNLDGTSPVTDLAGYRLYYGKAPLTYGAPIDVGNSTGYTVTGLEKGVRYYFAVAAYDASNNLSPYSDEVSKVIGAATEAGGWTQKLKNLADRPETEPFQIGLGLGGLVLLMILFRMRRSLTAKSMEVFEVLKKIFTKRSLKPIVISTLFTLLLPFTAAAAPVVLYTDILNGPNTGGENNNGTYLSIFGKGFGTSKGSADKVTINGVEVAVYKQWGAPSKVFSSHGIQVITVQPGSNVTSGPIAVTVGGEVSNTDHSFTVRPGDIFFVDYINGNDANNGSIASPKKSVQNLYNNRTIFGPGDTIIMREQTYSVKQSGRPYFVIFEDYPIGSEAAPTTVMGYPGEDVFINMPFYKLFGTYTVPSSNAGLVLSNFRGNTGGEQAFAFDTTEYVRLVNTDIQGMSLNGNGTGMISSHGNYAKILGNAIHNSGDNKYYHSIYWSNQGHDNEIGWNHIYDIRGGRGIQVYDAGPGPFYNYKVHDNIIHDVDRDGMAFGGPSTIGFKIYNNIVYRTGLGTSPYTDGSGGNGGRSGIQLSTTTLDGAEVYNNTLYDNQADQGHLRLGGKNLKVKNNIIIATSCYRDPNPGQTGCTANTGQYFFSLENGLDLATLSVSNNVWYSTVQPALQAVPSWDSSPLTTNPLVIDPTAPARNFHLQSGSPAIDKGTATIVARDLDGVVRAQDGPPDIGAYEYCSLNCPVKDVNPPAKPTGLAVK